MNTIAKHGSQTSNSDLALWERALYPLIVVQRSLPLSGAVRPSMQDQFRLRFYASKYKLIKLLPTISLGCTSATNIGPKYNNHFLLLTLCTQLGYKCSTGFTGLAIGWMWSMHLSLLYYVSRRICVQFLMPFRCTFLSNVLCTFQNAIPGNNISMSLQFL